LIVPAILLSGDILDFFRYSLVPAGFILGRAYTAFAPMIEGRLPVKKRFDIPDVDDIGIVRFLNGERAIIMHS